MIKFLLVVEVVEDKLFWHYFLPGFFKRIECLEVRYGKPLRYTKKRNDIFYSFVLLYL